MPLPLLLPLVPLGPSLVPGFVVYPVLRAIGKFVEENLKSRTLAILGAGGVGKSRLLIYAKFQILPEQESTQTTVPIKEAEYECANGNKITLRRNLDQPGTLTYKDEWKKIVKASDILVYIVRADQLFSGDKYQKESAVIRIERDMALINEWIQINPRKRKLYVLGSHCDKVPNLNSSSEKSIQEFQNLVPYSESFTPILADLKTKAGLERVLEQIIS